MRSGCLETRSSPAWGRAGCIKSGGASPCHLTGKLVSFRLYNFSSCAGAFAGKPMVVIVGVKNCSANLLQIQHNEAQVTLSHLLGLGSCVPMCAGGFFLAWS